MLLLLILNRSQVCSDIHTSNINVVSPSGTNDFICSNVCPRPPSICGTWLFLPEKQCELKLTHIVVHEYRSTSHFCTWTARRARVPILEFYLSNGLSFSRIEREEISHMGYRNVCTVHDGTACLLIYSEYIDILMIMVFHQVEWIVCCMPLFAPLR